MQTSIGTVRSIIKLTLHLWKTQRLSLAGPEAGLITASVPHCSENNINVSWDNITPVICQGLLHCVSNYMPEFPTGRLGEMHKTVINITLTWQHSQLKHGNWVKIDRSFYSSYSFSRQMWQHDIFIPSFTSETLIFYILRPFLENVQYFSFFFK